MTPPESTAVMAAPTDALEAGSVSTPAKRRRRPEVTVLVAVCWLVLVLGAAILADLLPLERYSVLVGEPRLSPHFGLPHPLGTDAFGRSVLSRVIYGARASLAVGVISTAMAMTIGVLAGMVAGYVRGRVDAIVLILTDSFLAFPPLVLLLAVRSAVSPSLTTLVVALGVLGSTSFVRLARASTMQVAQREFVLAARAQGASRTRILAREILPNILPPVGAYAFLVIAVLIVAEGSLSFLGLGVPAPTPSWGGMVAAGRDQLGTTPALVFVPSAFLLLTVFAFNVIGDWARRKFDTRESTL